MIVSRQSVILILVICFFVSALVQDQDTATSPIALELVKSQSGLPVQWPTGGIERLPDGRLVFVNKGDSYVHILSGEGTHLDSWKLSGRGAPLQFAHTPANELFIALGAPAEGHYYSFDGRKLESVKLYEAVVDSTFADDGLVYSILGGPGEWFINVCDRLQTRKKKISLDGAFTGYTNAEKAFHFAPLVKGEEVFVVTKAFPLLARFSTNGQHIATYDFNNPHFAKAVEKIGSGERGGLFTDIQWLGDDLLLCIGREDHSIDLVRLSREGKIRAIYTYNEINTSNRREYSSYRFCVLNEYPVKVACLEFFSGDLYILAAKKELQTLADRQNPNYFSVSCFGGRKSSRAGSFSKR